MDVGFKLLWWPLLSVPYGGGGRSSSHVNSLSDALHSAHSHPTLCEHRESGRAGLWNRRPHSYTFTGVRTISFLGSILTTARSIRSTNADSVLRRRRRLRDCIAYICLYRLHTSTSNIHTGCLVWMEPLLPWASIHLHGTICSLYLCIFYCYLLLMWVLIHTCTCMSS
jgi:hypothetical protein